MKVSDLGEFGLIDVLTRLVNAGDKNGEAWNNLIIGIGDDAAVWKCQADSQIATIDALVEGIHFKLGMTSWEELGWKSLAVNVSDIAAMGGLPRYALVSLALPPETDVNNITLFYQGMLALARKFNIAIVGGNISRSPIVTINVVVFGDSSIPQQRLLTRSSAKSGDRVAVTGYLGSAAAGLEMLTGGLQFDTKTTAVLRQAFLKPQPRVWEGRILIENGVRTGIDISDGLVSDLGHICEASGLGARISVHNIPIAPSVKANFSETALLKALSGGEDYELLFTAPGAVVEIVKKLLEAKGCLVTVIGEMVPGPGSKVILLGSNGEEFKSPAVGWDHFDGSRRGISRGV